jgi:hypothetical protein
MKLVEVEYLQVDLAVCLKCHTVVISNGADCIVS